MVPARFARPRVRERSLATMSGLSNLSVEPMTAAITIASLACPTVATGPCDPESSASRWPAGRKGTAGRSVDRSCRSHDPSSIPARTGPLGPATTRPPPATWWCRPPAWRGRHQSPRCYGGCQRWLGVPARHVSRTGRTALVAASSRLGLHFLASQRPVPISLYRRRRYPQAAKYEPSDPPFLLMPADTLPPVCWQAPRIQLRSPTVGAGIPAVQAECASGYLVISKPRKLSQHDTLPPYDSLQPHPRSELKGRQ